MTMRSTDAALDADGLHASKAEVQAVTGTLRSVPAAGCGGDSELGSIDGLHPRADTRTPPPGAGDGVDR